MMIPPPQEHNYNQCVLKKVYVVQWISCNGIWLQGEHVAIKEKEHS
jgi:hypothetical protein